MPGAKHHSPELRAQVMAALLAGQGVNEVARQYGIDQSVVSRWKAKLPASELHRIASQKVESFDELLAGCVRAALQAFTTICKETSRPEYIAKQSASEIAVLAGVLKDKALRVLSAFEPEPSAVGAESEAQELPSIH